MPSGISTAASYALTPDDMATALQFCIKANIPVMMWGQPGSAKSAVANQTSTALDMDLADVRLSQIDPVDIRGIPWRDGERTRWAPPAFFPDDTDIRPTLLFLDELSSATKMVQAAAYQLVLDRKCGEYELPESTRIVAAGNRVEDNAVAHRMSSALASRFVHIDMKIDVEAWVEWAVSGAANGSTVSVGDPKPGEIAMPVIFFMRYRPELISTFDPKSKELAFACPRTWEFVSRLVNAGLEGRTNVEMALLRGAIGEGAAVEFAAFLEVFRQLPDPMAVIDDPLGIAIPENPAAQIALCGAVARIAEENHMDAVVAFAKRADVRTEYGEYLLKMSVKFHPDSRFTNAHNRWESYLSKL